MEAGHMTAPDRGTIKPENSCIEGAVHTWLDATYLRQHGGVVRAYPRLGHTLEPIAGIALAVTVAAMVAVAIDSGGRRRIAGRHIGPSEAETSWASFLKNLVKRGMRGVKPVVSDAHKGLKAPTAATAATTSALWRSALRSPTGKSGSWGRKALFRERWHVPAAACSRRDWFAVQHKTGGGGVLYRCLSGGFLVLAQHRKTEIKQGIPSRHVSICLSAVHFPLWVEVWVG
jgi:hypothetical protein